ncbi:MAG: AraC family transcriptional regulator [Paenibacillaceae bacterium]|jgi:AraC-like DNA-binding protein|nr:AraC family transcriptional regulator [Paenibacillaceae bacterium]
MAFSCEELAMDFAKASLEVYGVYRTSLEHGVLYTGHVHQPTTKCAIIISLRGQAEFRFNETERYVLQPGKVLLGGVGKRLEIRTEEDGFEYGLVHYLPVMTDQFDARRLTGISLLHVELDPELQMLLDQLLRAAASPDSMGLLEKKSLFYRLVSKVMESERHYQNKDSYSLVDDAISYIQSHYAQPLTLSHLAERYQMKAKYFSYLFHKYTGIGPIDYLIRYRMNRAHELLLTGQYSVSAVARSVGYPDSYYFSRLFKKYAGFPPGQAGLNASRNRLF